MQTNLLSIVFNMLLPITLAILGLSLAGQVRGEEVNMDRMVDELTRKVYYDTQPKSPDEVYYELQQLRTYCLATLEPNNDVKRGRLQDAELLVSFHDVKPDQCFDRISAIKHSKEKFHIYKNLLDYLNHYERVQIEACGESMRASLSKTISAIDEQTREMLDGLLEEYTSLHGPGFQHSEVASIGAALVKYLERTNGGQVLRDRARLEALVEAKITKPCTQVWWPLGKQINSYLQMFGAQRPLQVDLHTLDWFERSELCRIILDNKADIVLAARKVLANDKSCTGCLPFLWRGAKKSQGSQ